MSRLPLLKWTTWYGSLRPSFFSLLGIGTLKHSHWTRLAYIYWGQFSGNLYLIFIIGIHCCMIKTVTFEVDAKLSDEKWHGQIKNFFEEK